MASKDTLVTASEAGFTNERNNSRLAVNLATVYLVLGIILLAAFVVGPTSGVTDDSYPVPVALGAIAQLVSFALSVFVFVNVLVSHFEKLARSNSK
jgi:hypothetical protein